jgi:major membrane immunogen (membrane-anchored lipoprotein)
MTIKDFYDQVANNDDMKKKVAELSKAGKSLEEIMKEFGIEGSVDDVKTYANKLVEEGKLDKSQLDDVAGGTTPVTTITTVTVTIGTVSIAKC